MKRLAEDIREHRFQRVYLLTGNESYLVRGYRKKLFEAAAGNDTMNTKVITDREVTPEEVRDFTDTLPFFAEKRVLLLEDCKLFKNASSEALIPWIETLPETALVILVDNEVDKRTRFYKAVQKAGTVVEMNHPEGTERSDYLLRQLGARNLKITKPVFELLLQALPDSLELSLNEMDKLAAYVGACNAVTAEAIGDIVTPKIENRIFKLVEAAVSGDRKTAFDIYYDLVALKEAPLRILSLVGKELMRLVVVKEMAAEGASSRTVSEKAGMPEFVARKLLSEARKKTAEELSALVEKALQYESDVKSGNLSDSASVELLLMELTKKDGGRS